ncbi:hypothetical protein [Arthrobacter burdickii]|uniref:Uncharacterized protein n=1 Tax=Arthrobacter burdickii TaxID=3035920 RepID=A0ABT8JXK9_9MICC|nr:hypothetical protein [Arthrobacter burdickii]MDN4609592.1 hypothetical protein [Arthrobacter burdickii]
MGNENDRSEDTTRHDGASAPNSVDQIRASSNWHACRHLYGGWTRERTIERMQSVAPGFPPEAYERELTRAMEWAEEHRQDGLRRRRSEIEEAKTLDVLNAVFVLYLLNTRYGHQYVQDGLGYIHIQHELGSTFSSEEIEAAKQKADEVIKSASNLVGRSWDGPHMEQLQAGFPGYTNDNLSAALGHAYFLNR